jgi:uncharacterized iron-regulated membrane protein
MLPIALGGGTGRAILIVLACLTIALAILLLWSLRRVERLVRRVDSVFVWQHRRRTPVATIAGLVAALEKGLDQGGLTPDQRRAIYTAIDEQLELFYRLDESFPAVEDDHDEGPRGKFAALKHRLRGRRAPTDSGIARQADATAQP